MDINNLNNYVYNNNIINIKNNIINTIKDRLCHHKVKFLNLLLNYCNGNIKNYLEIGVHNGCSMGYVLQSNYKLDCYGIDLFEDTFYKDDLNQSKIYSNLQKLNKNNNNLHLIKGNSLKYCLYAIPIIKSPLLILAFEA